MKHAWLVTLLLWGCGEDEAECSGASVDPFPVALAFGDVKEADLPARRVVLLRNTCGTQLEIGETCIIEDDHNGDPNDPAFELEKPSNETLNAGEEGGIRVTYSPSSVNEDQDQDAARDLDQALLVVQSNASDSPTLVVPLCGRRIAENEDKDDQECPPAFTIPEGERIADLCQR